MKLYFLRALVMWRRFRRSARHHADFQLHSVPQLEALMKRADPAASWHERANWIIDVAEWARREPKVSRMKDAAWRRIKHQRIRILLDWLDANRDTRRLVQLTLQKTLREAAGAELFFTTGLPREPGFFNEISEKLAKFLLPKPPAQLDLSGLFMAMFSEPGDAEWLLGLDQETVSRIWKLCADDGITHTYRQQIDEALHYLVAVVLSAGISPAFRQRLDPSNSLQATPFMGLRRELERYLQSGHHDAAALRSVRMLIAVCQAQTDRIYAHLDEHGVSVSLVYSIERMRAQLARMLRLIDLRAASMHPNRELEQMQALLADMAIGHRHRASMRGLIKRSFSLLGRKMVERNAAGGEQYAARNRTEYQAVIKAAAIGGAVAVFTVLGRLTLSGSNVAHFFVGLSASLNYLLSFTVIALLGGMLAAKQSAVMSPALAAKMSELETGGGLQALLLEAATLLRAQAAAVVGNIVSLAPLMLLASLAVFLWSGAPLVAMDKAQANLQALSIMGATPIWAAVTGILLWLAGMMACFADNWFALRRLRESLMHHRRLVHALGAARAERWALWLERHVAVIVGNLGLALILGMTPVFAQFFGVPFEIRHVTFATGTLVASVGSLGWPIVESRAFWLAAGGIVLVAVLNIGVAFACSLAVALRTNSLPARIRRAVFTAFAKRFVMEPRFFLLPGREEEAQEALRDRGLPVPALAEQKKRLKNNL